MSTCITVIKPKSLFIGSCVLLAVVLTLTGLRIGFSLHKDSVMQKQYLTFKNQL